LQIACALAKVLKISAKKNTLLNCVHFSYSAEKLVPKMSK